jgi:hypothetical protein
VEAHWRRELVDGVGVRAGVQPNGSTTFALRGTLARLRDWLAEVGTEAQEKVNEYGSVVSASRTYRPVTPFVQVGWAPPPAQPGRSVVSFGAELLDSTRQLPGRKADTERALAATAWLAWTVAAVWTVAPDPTAPPTARRLVVRSHKLDKGIDVVGEGEVIPWHVKRGNGWTCAALTCRCPPRS